MGIGWTQILIVLLIVVLLFGAGKIPRLMGDVAKGIKSFKSGMKEELEEADAKPAEQPKNLENQSANVSSEEKANKS